MAREFWLRFDLTQRKDVILTASDIQKLGPGASLNDDIDYIHVIEYGAMSDVMNAHEKLEQKYAELTAERDRYKAALEDLEFQSCCSWCESNIVIREEALGSPIKTKTGDE